MQKKYTGPRNQEDSKPYASIDANQEIGPVLNIGIATILDVLDIEVKVPSLSTPERSIWISTSRGYERFVNEIHRHNPEIVNYSSSLRTKEEHFDNARFESVKPDTGNRDRGPEGSNIAESNDKPSSELRKAEVSTTSATSSKGSNHIVLKPRTYSTYTKKEIQGEHRIWNTIPGCQNCMGHSSETHISNCVTNMVHNMINVNEKKMDQCIGMPYFQYLKGRSKNQLGREFTNEDWLRCFLSWKLQNMV